MNKFSNKVYISIIFFILTIMLCVLNRYEYTKSSNGKIYQRINRFTSNVEILCCTCKNECKWQNGNMCPYTTRQQLINYGHYYHKSIADINKALDKNCFYPLSIPEINAINKK